MIPNHITGTTRRYQSPSAANRRVVRAYHIMAFRADAAEARSNGGWVNMLGGPAYERWARARAHALLCRQLGARTMRAEAA